MIIDRGNLSTKVTRIPGDDVSVDVCVTSTSACHDVQVILVYCIVEVMRLQDLQARSGLYLMKHYEL